MGVSAERIAGATGPKNRGWHLRTGLRYAGNMIADPANGASLMFAKTCLIRLIETERHAAMALTGVTRVGELDRDCLMTPGGRTPGTTVTFWRVPPSRHLFS